MKLALHFWRWTEKHLLQKSINSTGFGIPTSSDDFFAIFLKNFHPSISHASMCSITNGIVWMIEPPGNCCLSYTLLSFCLLSFLQQHHQHQQMWEDVTALPVGKGDVKIDVVYGVGVKKTMFGLLSVVMYLFLGSLR